MGREACVVRLRARWADLGRGAVAGGPGAPAGGWPEQILEQLFSDPYTYVSEAAGAAVVVALLASLIRARGLRDFVLNGRMGPSGAGRPKGRLAAGQERPQGL